MQSKPGEQILSLQRPGCMVILVMIKPNLYFLLIIEKKVQGIVAHEFIHALGKLINIF